jgi:preprotein translocase SecE subunit
MAVVTKGDEGSQPMADDAGPEGVRRPQEPQQSQNRPSAGHGQVVSPPTGPGFLHIYKPGQGYWTRMGTAAGTMLLLLVIGHLLYTSLKVYLVPPLTIPWVIAIVSVVVLGVVVFLWWYLNKPAVVDFFIATESEMKKVNWTSRKDLAGSTKVVIVFMFLIAAILFVIDIAFGYLFWLIRVLKHGPFA